MKKTVEKKKTKKAVKQNNKKATKTKKDAKNTNLEQKKVQEFLMTQYTKL